MKTWRITVILLVCIVLLVEVQPAFAALGSWVLRISWNNFSGTSDAWSGRMVRKLSSSQWAADIVSYTDTPPITITLGWTYFSATERCALHSNKMCRADLGRFQAIKLLTQFLLVR